MFPRIISYVLLVASLLACVKSEPTQCEICQEVSDLVERVLIYNATATTSFKDAGSNLCKYVPEIMKYTVRIVLSFKLQYLIKLI